MAFVSVLLPVLIQADIYIPSSIWLAMAIAGILLFSSPYLGLKHLPKFAMFLSPIEPQDLDKETHPLPFVLAIFSVLFLGSVTLWAGGTFFHVLRGNGTDAFNYATMAKALEHFSFSFITNTDVTTLTTKDPILGLAKTLLTGRWATGALLGWCSTISGKAAVQITFAFGYLCLTISAGPCFLIARSLGCAPWPAAGITVAILAGFWGQVVLDMQTLSHLHAMPLVFLIIYSVLKTQEQPWKFWIGNARLLLVLATSALTLAYIEFLPLLILGLALHFLRVFLWRKISLRQMIVDSLPAAGGIALGFWISPNLFEFLKNQIYYGSTVINNWHQAYFRWLYNNPLGALWGLTHLDAGYLHTNWVAKALWDIFTGIPAIVLAGAAVIFLMETIRKSGRNPACSIVSSFLVAGLVQTMFLLLRHQWWAGGKAISFLIPFLWLGASTVLFTELGNIPFIRKGIVARYIRWLAIFWLASQIMLGCVRVGIAAAGSDYKKYISHHGLYRQHDWNLDSITQARKKVPPGSIALITEDLWLAEYLSLSLKPPLRFASELIDRTGNPLSSPTESRDCPLLLVDRRLYPGIPHCQQRRLIAKTRSLILLDLNWDKSSIPLLVAIRNPNGLEWTPDGKSFIWIGGQETTLWITSPAEGTAFLSGKWSPGPSFPETSDRTLEVFGPKGFSAKFLIQPATSGLPIPLHRGINLFKFRAREQPTITSLPSGDTRPLILGFWNPHVSSWDQRTPSP